MNERETLATLLEKSYNGHPLHIDLDRQQVEMICAALRQPETARPEIATITPEQIKEPGWYYRVDDDEYVRVERQRFPVMKSGLLPPLSGVVNERYVERWDTHLVLQGMAYPPDWGKEFIGPINTPRSPLAGFSEPDWREKYEAIIRLLRATKLPHGRCEPRSEQACTNCNATDTLRDIATEGTKP